MEDVQGDERHHDASREGVLVLVSVDSEREPDEATAQQHERGPVLHDRHRDPAQVSAGPAADVLAVGLVLYELRAAADQGEQLDGARHKEELVGAPNVVHVQGCNLVGVHTLHDVVAESIDDDEAPVQKVDHQHEGHHALVVEVVIHPEESRVVVEADPEEGRPEPEEVGQVVHGDDQSRPPPHLVRERAPATSCQDLCKHRDEEQREESEDGGDAPKHELNQQARHHLQVHALSEQPQESWAI
mmetsp:Transcript_95044/g.283814  ORF Transcript_95044/g.283814 Transcript_95044/m.283814 type:complete len:244 (+) Transcript_95044:337-1068(+)